MKVEENSIKFHKQKSEYSCIPSAVEMILKLLKKVSVDYYDLQNQWGDKKDGNFSCFERKTINGVTFQHKFDICKFPRGSMFPMDALFTAIDSELNSDRLVIVALSTNGGWHNYVIYEKEGNEYKALRKYYGVQDLCYENSIKNRVQSIQGTDILTYNEEALPVY